MKNIPFTLLLVTGFLCSYVPSLSQTFSVHGEVKDESEANVISGASVLLQHPDESSNIQGVITDRQGKFRLDNIAPGKYVLTVQYMGYKELRKDIHLTQHLDLGTLSLQEEMVVLEEVIVTASVPPGRQQGDTTQFNAGAYKTMPDANAQKLVEKLPGVTVMDGKLQAQGEDVQRILVDGKEFFGTDVKAALQSLPAEVISQIQIFDKKSDKAEMSGFDDGEREKTINIITKPNRKKGQFGKVSAGYGTGDRYMVGGSVNLFNNDRRTTITGISNNINALDYSADPNSQDNSRTQDGIINANSIGVNFSDDWGTKVDVSGSYLFSSRGSLGNATLTREYLLPSDSGQIYNEKNSSDRNSTEHRFNARVEYNIDSNNRIIFRPSISLQDNNNFSAFSGHTVTDNGPLNETENSIRSINNNYDFNNRMYYSHRFGKKGRSLTAGLNTGYHTNEDNAHRNARNVFHSTVTREELLNQESLLDRAGFSWNAEISYTEPVGKRGQLEFEYEIGDMLNSSDRLTYNLYEDLEPDHTLRQLDSVLSNAFSSRYLSQEAEVGYQYQTDKLRLQIEAEYQQSNLRNRQKLPSAYEIERTFGIVLPTVRVDYNFSKSRSLEFDYDTWTNAPSIDQLQDVIDNSNPLHLNTGNPDLDQSMTNRLSVRYRDMNQRTDHTFFVYAASSFIKDNISGSTLIADEPTEIRKGIILEKGSQLGRLVNLDGYRDFRSWVSYGMPIKSIKSNIGVHGGINYTRRPGMINNDINFVNSSNYRFGLSLSSNISKTLDFNISTRASYNVVENSLRPALNNNFFNQSTRLSLDWMIWDGVIYRANVNHQVNAGLAESYNNSFSLVNMSLGKKIFPNERGEVSLNVYDLLEQNNNVRRSISELYIQDMQSNVLQRYFMLTFIYNLRHFSKGASAKDFKEILN